MCLNSEELLRRIFYIRFVLCNVMSNNNRLRKVHKNGHTCISLKRPFILPIEEIIKSLDPDSMFVHLVLLPINHSSVIRFYDPSAFHFVSKHLQSIGFINLFRSCMFEQNVYWWWKVSLLRSFIKLLWVYKFL